MQSGKAPRTGRAARLAEYLCQQTGIQVSEETVRVYFHAHDYVCKRPIWTDASVRPITWETCAGRGSVSRCHSTRASTGT
jgi:Winged helix-turn helix